MSSGEKAKGKATLAEEDGSALGAAATVAASASGEGGGSEGTTGAAKLAAGAGEGAAAGGGEGTAAAAGGGGGGGGGGEGGGGATSAATSSASTASGAATKEKKKPTVILVVGMAGSGKTSLMQRLNAQTRQDGKTPYVINLDPAVGNLGYEANIDIRETVKYKDVMRKYGLGPNGAIVTSLNLFATRFDQVLDYTEKRAAAGEIDYVLIDTPGQIEVFTWSASGDIITQSLASSFPTVLVYVVDTARTTSPSTFMSNMLYVSLRAGRSEA